MKNINKQIIDMSEYFLFMSAPGATCKITELEITVTIILKIEVWIARNLFKNKSFTQNACFN